MTESDWSNRRPMDQVREFHLVYGLPVAEKPGIPSEEQIRLRQKLLEEEYYEAFEAVLKNDIVNLAQELADIIYIVCGTALTYGIPLDRVFDAVHRSNMSKLDTDGSVIRREDGKILKGPDYFPPNIEEILNGQDGTVDPVALEEPGSTK